MGAGEDDGAGFSGQVLSESKIESDYVQSAYFKSLDSNFKVGVSIYVENLINGKHTTLDYLAQILSEDLNKKGILRALRALEGWGLAKGAHFEPKSGFAGHMYILTGVGEDQFKMNYEEMKKEMT